MADETKKIKYTYCKDTTLSFEKVYISCISCILKKDMDTIEPDDEEALNKLKQYDGIDAEKYIKKCDKENTSCQKGKRIDLIIGVEEVRDSSNKKLLCIENKYNVVSKNSIKNLHQELQEKYDDSYQKIKNNNSKLKILPTLIVIFSSSYFYPESLTIRSFFDRKLKEQE